MMLDLDAQDLDEFLFKFKQGHGSSDDRGTTEERTKFTMKQAAKSVGTKKDGTNSPFHGGAWEAPKVEGEHWTKT